MNGEDREALATALRPRLNAYIPHVPTAKQQAALLLDEIREVLYGGAAGGGKSDWLLMGALQFADVPDYGALLLRRTYKELSMEGGLLERAHEWLGPTGASWHASELKWEFPSGAVLQFGYLDGQHDHLRYQSTEWQYVGFDELTHFRELQYRYLFSRLRRLAGSRIPIRMRAASNPGGPGHDWVKGRFAIYRSDAEDAESLLVCHDPAWVAEHERIFVPATIADNPHLDQAEYERSLAELTPRERAQLLKGDWDAVATGDLFRREFFEIVDAAPLGETVRYWDLAATEPHTNNQDPDWTVGTRLTKAANGLWFVEHVARFRKRPHGVEERAKAIADEDGLAVTVGIEQEPGASGKAMVAHWQRNVLPRHEVRVHAPSDAKGVRARPFAAKAEAGLVKVLRGPWNGPWFDELESFPEGEHDDQVDSVSGAFTLLNQRVRADRVQYREDPTKVPEVVRGDLRLRGRRYVDKE